MRGMEKRLLRRRGDRGRGEREGERRGKGKRRGRGGEQMKEEERCRKRVDGGDGRGGEKQGVGENGGGKAMRVNGHYDGRIQGRTLGKFNVKPVLVMSFNFF